MGSQLIGAVRERFVHGGRVASQAPVGKCLQPEETHVGTRLAETAGRSGEFVGGVGNDQGTDPDREVGCCGDQGIEFTARSRPATLPDIDDAAHRGEAHRCQ